MAIKLSGNTFGTELTVYGVRVYPGTEEAGHKFLKKVMDDGTKAIRSFAYDYKYSDSSPFRGIAESLRKVMWPDGTRHRTLDCAVIEPADLGVLDRDWDLVLPRAPGDTPSVLLSNRVKPQDIDIHKPDFYCIEVELLSRKYTMDFETYNRVLQVYAYLVYNYRYHHRDAFLISATLYGCWYQGPLLKDTRFTMREMSKYKPSSNSWFFPCVCEECNFVAARMRPVVVEDIRWYDIVKRVLDVPMPDIPGYTGPAVHSIYDMFYVQTLDHGGETKNVNRVPVWHVVDDPLCGLPNHVCAAYKKWINDKQRAKEAAEFAWNAICGKRTRSDKDKEISDELLNEDGSFDLQPVLRVE